MAIATLPPCQGCRRHPVTHRRAYEDGRTLHLCGPCNDSVETIERWWGRPVRVSHAVPARRRETGRRIDYATLEPWDLPDVLLSRPPR
jgi:hypothetical protein